MGKEYRVYLISREENYEINSNEDFINYAEFDGNIYSIESFCYHVNEGLIDTSDYYILITNKY